MCSCLKINECGQFLLCSQVVFDQRLRAQLAGLGPQYHADAGMYDIVVSSTLSLVSEGCLKQSWHKLSRCSPVIVEIQLARTSWLVSNLDIKVNLNIHKYLKSDAFHDHQCMANSFAKSSVDRLNASALIVPEQAQTP